MNLVSKISFKSVCGAPEMVAVEFTDADGVKKTALRGVEKQYMRLVGVVKKLSLATSQYGDSVAFEGDFRAINLVTGEVYNGAKLFLPHIAEAFASNAYMAAEMAEGFNGLELAFDLGIKPASTPAGYEYTVKPLIEQKAVDRLADLLNSLPALPAPASEKAADKPTKTPKSGE
jgi:hypothetical protein